MKRLVLIFVIVLGGGIAWLLMTNSPIDSVAWQPPAAPAMLGKFAPNTELTKAELIAQGQVYGPEDVALDSQGVIYGGTQDGKIVRVHPDGRFENWVETGGRPLGLHFDSAGHLIVCDAYKGLLSIDKSGQITVLSNAADGGAFVFTDDLDISSDGKIYFTDASSKWNQSAYMLDLLETKPYGRFMVYDPATKETTVLLKDMYFPNGVALSKNEDFVLINETWRYRIVRYWLTGENAGKHDIFLENLPGFPDGISSNRNGIFWLALPTPRNDKVDNMYPKPWLKNLVVKLPEFIQPKPVEYGFVLGLSETGEVIYNLQEPTGQHVKEITSVEEHQGFIYLGSLHNDRFARLKLTSVTKLSSNADLPGNDDES
ncbi:MAG: SMP-30/gluconolactonase/LRE family protein [Pseudomonadales bacterium]|nr:SMP-30/gluconolactonase/LRE family protein [Pseudomonadales bacterium]